MKTKLLKFLKNVLLKINSKLKNVMKTKSRNLENVLWKINHWNLKTFYENKDPWNSLKKLFWWKNKIFENSWKCFGENSWNFEKCSMGMQLYLCEFSENSMYCFLVMAMIWSLVTDMSDRHAQWQITQSQTCFTHSLTDDIYFHSKSLLLLTKSLLLNNEWKGLKNARFNLDSKAVQNGCFQILKQCKNICSWF
jgi:hypothetical protein